MNDLEINGKILIIENSNKMVGQMFCNGRFTCLQVQKTEQNYRFQFNDSKKAHTWLWVEIGRIPKWDTEDQKWYYRVQDNNHFISADWFTFDNAVTIFTKQLERMM
jgi:hypothetical protein